MRIVMEYKVTGVRKKDGLRFNCTMALFSLGSNDADEKLYRIECPALLTSPIEFDEDGDLSAHANSCMMLQVLLERFGISLEDKTGAPFQLPSPESIDPGFPTREERARIAKEANYFRKP